MIDTISFKVHDLKVHEDLHMSLINEISKNGVQTFVSHLPLMEYEQKTTAKREHIFHNYKDSKLVKKRVSARYKYISPSSKYACTFKINEVADYINIELSLPKYFYGNNLNQLVKNRYEPDFDYSKASKLSSHINYAYDHITLLFLDLKKNLKPKFSNKDYLFKKDLIEISRLDLCFNQVFSHKNETESYFKTLKRREILGATAEKKSTYGNETIMWVFKDYSFKVYMKGPEFKKDDSPILQKKNEYYSKHYKNYKRYDINSMQNFANRILRYEITLRKGKLNDLYYSKVFRSLCGEYQKKLRIYKRVRAFTLDGTITGKSVLYEEIKKPESKNKYRKYFDSTEDFKLWKHRMTEYRNLEFKKHKRRMKKLYDTNKVNSKDYQLSIDSKTFQFEIKVSSAEKEIYKEIKKRIGTRFTFMLGAKMKNDIWAKYQQNENDLFDYRNVRFSEKLFSECFNFFKERYFEIQTKEKLDIEQCLSKIEDFNINTENIRIRELKTAEMHHNALLNRLHSSLELQEKKDEIIRINDSISAELKRWNKQKKSILRRSKKINGNKLISLMLMLESRTFSEIQQLQLYPKSTLNDWRRDMKKVGIWNNVDNLGKSYTPNHTLEPYYIEQTFGKSLKREKMVSNVRSIKRSESEMYQYSETLRPDGTFES